jgi:hypothetical protein
MFYDFTITTVNPGVGIGQCSVDWTDWIELHTSNLTMEGVPPKEAYLDGCIYEVEITARDLMGSLNPNDKKFRINLFNNPPTCDPFPTAHCLYVGVPMLIDLSNQCED